MSHQSQLCRRLIQTRHMAMLISLLVAFCYCSRAQQPLRDVVGAPAPLSHSPAEQSDLARDNLNRVAAPAILLKEILIGDPGLMVELKRFVAQEASDNGQLISDEDLTDD